MSKTFQKFILTAFLISLLGFTSFLFTPTVYLNSQIDLPTGSELCGKDGCPEIDSAEDDLLLEDVERSRLGGAESISFILMALSFIVTIVGVIIGVILLILKNKKWGIISIAVGPVLFLISVIIYFAISLYISSDIFT